MTKTLTPDICVIGAGSGGLSVAAAAAAFGAPVVLVEKGEMGGDCLNYGCVPSKALLAAGRHAQAIREAPDFGISVEGLPSVSFAKVAAHVRSVIAAIAPNDSQERFTAMGVTVIREHARFTDRRTVTAGDAVIKARRFVIATGSSPLAPPIPGLGEVPFFTNETVFENRSRIAHLVIIGGGPVGMEMAQAHRRLGSAVTVLEAGRALAREDPELASVVTSRLAREGVAIYEGAKVTGVGKQGRSGVRVHFETSAGASKVDGSHLLVAAGRKANVEEMGLDAAGVAFDRSGIRTNAGLRTSNRRIYAIGDVAGGPQFTHVANYHAGIVVRALLFRLPARVDVSAVPRVTYTDPELAHAGMTEEEARARHGRISVARWPFSENDRAQAERRTEGLVKLVADRKGRILGASIAGAHAGEMIGFWALAISKKMTLRDIAGQVAPYPTLSEAGRRAAISQFAPLARRPLVRALTGLLRRLG